MAGPVGRQADGASTLKPPIGQLRPEAAVVHQGLLRRLADSRHFWRLKDITKFYRHVRPGVRGERPETASEARGRFGGSHSQETTGALGLPGGPGGSIGSPMSPPGLVMSSRRPSRRRDSRSITDTISAAARGAAVVRCGRAVTPNRATSAAKRDIGKGRSSPGGWAAVSVCQNRFSA